MEQNSEISKMTSLEMAQNQKYSIRNNIKERKAANCHVLEAKICRNLHVDSFLPWLNLLVLRAHEAAVIYVI